MNQDFFNIRSQLLQEEVSRARLNVQNLTEQLEQAKNHLNQVAGHLNEVSYLAGEAAKMEEAKKQQDAKHDDANSQDAQ